ncbi:MAG: class I SAM-dependent methyltransferase [Victivallales bacterium]|jgi:hypothetical protein
MSEQKQNYYGRLCTELYEILHEKAPQDELDFYLSYAEKGQKILEPLCGSGRFLVPFMERGFDIDGMDSSIEMLEKLKQKAPDAKIIHADILEYSSNKKYDYIFISSGSVSLFTNIEQCKSILKKLKDLLAPKGRFVFAVDTVADRCADDDDYKISVSVKNRQGFDLVLKTKNYYAPQTHTQFSPGKYELYDGDKLLQQELMDFQTHLYELGELEPYLKDIGFTSITVYSSFDKNVARSNDAEMFLYECCL